MTSSLTGDEGLLGGGLDLPELNCASLSRNTIASVCRAMTADELRSEARRVIALACSSREP